MVRSVKFSIIFAPEVLDHLDAIELKHHSLLERVIDEQLSFTPDVETRNRKLLEQPAPFDAIWELRFGPNNRFRLFYDIDEVDHRVFILAIGVKIRERLMIGGEEFSL